MEKGLEQELEKGYPDGPSGQDSMLGMACCQGNDQNQPHLAPVDAVARKADIRRAQEAVEGWTCAASRNVRWRSCCGEWPVTLFSGMVQPHA